MLFSSKALLLLKLVSDMIQVSSHGTEVRYCLTKNNKLRIFVEHWHGDLSSASSAGTMNIQDVNTGATSTLAPDGVINNRVNTNLVTVGDCQGDETFLAGACSDAPKNDWVYFDFDADCETPPMYKLLQGNTDVLKEATGCSLYPTTITLATACAVVTDSPSLSVVPSTLPSYVPSSVPSNFPSLLPSNLPSNSPSSCLDEPGWKLFSYTCSDIETFISGNAGTCDGMNDYVYLDKNVKQACCACGGGLGSSRVPSSTPSALPSISFNPTQFSSLTPSTNPSKFSSLTPSSTPSNFTSSVPSLSPSLSPSITHSGNPSMFLTNIPSQTPSVCIDEPDWKFLSVYSCVEVEAFIAIDENFCDGILDYRHLDKTLKEACCACGGGIGISRSPSLSPSALPSITSNPSEVPSTVPSSIPSDIPSDTPSSVPSSVPSLVPSNILSMSPSEKPSGSPSSLSSEAPSKSPSDLPSSIPSQVPSDFPSSSPTLSPTKAPTPVPTASPTATPTKAPTKAPTEAPTLSPTSAPTESPTIFCADSTIDFRVTKTVNGNKKSIPKSCEWVNESNTEKRCQAFKSHCPASCAKYFTPTCETDSLRRFVWKVTRKTLKDLKSCGWVSKNKRSRCRLPGVSSTCRKTCNYNGPCTDSELKFKFSRDSQKSRSCGYVKKKRAKRCRNYFYRRHCPQTCKNYRGGRYCKRNTKAKYNLVKKIRKTIVFKGCKYVAGDPSERCQKSGVKETCRATCASF